MAEENSTIAQAGQTAGNQNENSKAGNLITVGKRFVLPNGQGFTVLRLENNGRIIGQGISRVLRPKDRLSIVTDNSRISFLFNQRGLAFSGGEYLPPVSPGDIQGGTIAFTLNSEESIPEGNVQIVLKGSQGAFYLSPVLAFLSESATPEEAQKKKQLAEEKQRTENLAKTGVGSSLGDAMANVLHTAGSTALAGVFGGVDPGLRQDLKNAMASGDTAKIRQFAQKLADSGDSQGLSEFFTQTSDPAIKNILQTSLAQVKSRQFTRSQSANLRTSGDTTAAVASQKSSQSLGAGGGAGASVGQEISARADISGQASAPINQPAGQVPLSVSNQSRVSGQTTVIGNVDSRADAAQTIEQTQNTRTSSGRTAETEAKSHAQISGGQALKQTSGQISQTTTASEAVSSPAEAGANISAGGRTQTGAQTQKQTQAGVSNRAESEPADDRKARGNVARILNVQGRKEVADTQSQKGGKARSLQAFGGKMAEEENSKSPAVAGLSGGQDSGDYSGQSQKTSPKAKIPFLTKSGKHKETAQKGVRLTTEGEEILARVKSREKPLKQASAPVKSDKRQSFGQAQGAKARSLPAWQQTAKPSAEPGFSLARSMPDFENVERPKIGPISHPVQNALPGSSKQADRNPVLSQNNQIAQGPQAGQEANRPTFSALEKEQQESAASSSPNQNAEQQEEAQRQAQEQALVKEAPLSHAVDEAQAQKNKLAKDALKSLAKKYGKEFAASALAALWPYLLIALAILLAIVLLIANAIFVIYIGCNNPIGKTTIGGVTSYRLSYIGAYYPEICERLDSASSGSFVSSQENAVTPQGLLSTANWTQLIQQTAANYQPVDACILRVVVQKESAGQANVIGCDCAYNGNASACLNQPKTYYPGYQFNWPVCSYGIGLTQWTIYQSKYASVLPSDPNYYKRWQDASTPSRTPFGASFYTVSDLLDPQTSLNLTAQKFQAELKKNGGDVRAAFASYVGSSSSQSQFVNERMQLYDMCKANGG